MTPETCDDFEQEDLPDAVREAFWNYPRVMPRPDFNERLMAKYRLTKSRGPVGSKAGAAWRPWSAIFGRDRLSGAALCGAVTGYLLLSLVLHCLGISSAVAPSRAPGAGMSLISASGERSDEWLPGTGQGGQ